MHRYEQDYQSTKTEVYETAGKTSKKATQIAVLAVLGLLFLGSIVMNNSIWTIERALLVQKAQKIWTNILQMKTGNHMPRT